MSTIERVKDKTEGPLDGVSLNAYCVVTDFGNQGGKVKIKKQKVHPCNIKASYEIGTVSFSVRNRKIMVAVRLDELMEVLKEASLAAMEVREKRDKNDEEVKQ
ncbi:hypothetical protein [Calorimonas adulescens]|uniref:Uncharacterized protein n=1 Tax=Calorimonas adulescens TaxID=2606906 RepID=A0A5D8QG71_9THEO|nr:hypothetical protein [Calorimonas adulescens]TZE83555.1 hypothetical protein FWJ32_01370 [Calorimonas adulescens]